MLFIQIANQNGTLEDSSKDLKIVCILILQVHSYTFACVSLMRCPWDGYGDTVSAPLYGHACDVRGLECRNLQFAELLIASGQILSVVHLVQLSILPGELTA